MSASGIARRVGKYVLIGFAVLVAGLIAFVLIATYTSLNEYRTEAAPFRDLENATSVSVQEGYGGPLTAAAVELYYVTDDPEALRAEMTALLVANGWSQFDGDDDNLWTKPGPVFPAWLWVGGPDGDEPARAKLRFGHFEG